MEIYNEKYYKEYDVGLKDKIDYQDSQYTKGFLEKVADRIVADFHPKTVLDAGCAMGHLVAALRDRGVEAYGIDVSRYAISMVREDIKPYCVVGSLSEPFPEILPTHFDLVTNIEVIEHMYEEDGEKAIANLCSVTDTILFSSSPDDFTEPTHVNVQQREYWCVRFAKNGFYDAIMSRPTFISPQAMCFQKRSSFVRQIEQYEHTIRLTEAQFNKEIQDWKNAVVGKDQHIEKLNAYIQEKQKEADAAIADWKDAVAGKDQHIEKLNAYIQEKQKEADAAIADWKDAVVGKDQHIEKLNTQIQEEQAVASEWKSTAEQEKRRAVHLKLELEQCHQEKKNLAAENEQIAQERETAASNVAELTNKVSALQYDNAQLGYHYQLALDLYQEVTNSTIWKITKPIRKVLDKVKSFLRAHHTTRVLYESIVCFVKQGPRSAYYKLIEYRNASKAALPESVVPMQGVKFSILVPLYHTPEKYLREMLESVVNQTYQNWELCLCDASEDDLSVQEVCAQYTATEKRIIYQHLDANMGISGNTNMCAKLATGDYLVLLDHDDFLMPDALAENARVINELGPDVLYSDEDHYTSNHVHINPFFKPNWSPDLLCSQMYIGHLLVFRRDLFEAIGGFRKEFDGSQDYDLMLRMSEVTDNIYHIPLILYSWRESETSTAANANAKPYAHEAGRKALDEHLKKCYGCEAHADDGPFTFVYDARFPSNTDLTVSIIIPMKDKWELTDACIRSILDKSTYENYEILILDNRSEEEATQHRLREIEKVDDRIHVMKADMEFNWSKINNFGARNSNGDIYVFLNNDTLVITPDWLERLCENALREEIGTVGALLKYEDETIQHAGVLVGFGGWADHIFKGMDAIHFGAPFVSPMVSRNVTAVTGACVAISKEKFEKLGGFDESFIICGSDVELGIRANNAGLFNRYDANIQLYHLESKSRSSYIPDEDFKRSYECYTPYREGCDPFFNPNLDINSIRPKEKCSANPYRNQPLKPQDMFRRKSFEVVSTIEALPPSNAYRIPEIEPMNARIGKSTQKIRINLLSPSVDKQHVFGGIATAIRFFESLCASLDCDTRIILTDASYCPGSSVLDSKYVFVSCEEDSCTQYQVIPFSNRHGRTIPVNANDIFVATGWWTAYTVSDIIRWQNKTFGIRMPLIYLIQDYEPGFYPWSSRFMLADSTYKMEIPVYAVFNSELLEDHFVKNGYHFEKSWAFDPVLNAKLAELLPKETTVSKKKQILIYGRPNTDRNAFSLIVMALKKWADTYDNAGDWTLLAAGEKFDPIALSDKITLKSAGKLSLEKYAKVLLDSYAGISLMVSPHPSYPPLEMSTFGVKTITNQYAHKDLASFNDNIVSLQACSPKVISEALSQLCDNFNGHGEVVHTDYSSGVDTITPIIHELAQTIKAIGNNRSC